MDLLECMMCGVVNYCKSWSTIQVCDPFISDVISDLTYSYSFQQESTCNQWL